MFYQRGDNTGGWITTTAQISTTICPSGGCSTLRFRFLCGSQDATCGYYIGSTLYIDGVSVEISGFVVTDAVVKDIIERIEYSNTSDNPATSKPYTVELEESNNDVGSGNATILIAPVNDPVTAGADSNSTNEDSALTVPDPGVLTNDTDPDTGDTLAVTANDATSAQGAAVSVDASGAYTYDRTAASALQGLGVGDSVVDTFSYTVSDGVGTTDTGTVSITVSGVNDPPRRDR